MWLAWDGSLDVVAEGTETQVRRFQRREPAPVSVGSEADWRAAVKNSPEVMSGNPPRRRTSTTVNLSD